MSKLKLTESPKRTLEIERPDGRTVNLVLRRFTVIEADKLSGQIKHLEAEFKKGSITSWDYISKQLGLMLSNFKPDDFSDLEYQNIILIADKCRELIEEKPEAEKKSQEG